MKGMWFGLALTFGAHGSDVPAIPVFVYNYSDAPRAELDAGLSSAARILRSAGVSLKWIYVQDGPELAVDLKRLPLVVNVLGDAGGSGSCLGAAFVPTIGQGYIARVAWRRLRSFAEGHRRSVATVLGTVIAHEIGHLLGRSHSVNGVMKTTWSKVELNLAAQGRLLFDRKQAASIRESAAQRWPEIRLASSDR